MKVLVDSSVWIDFFRRRNNVNRLPTLLVEDLAVTNPLILAEIIPALELKNERETVRLLRTFDVFALDPDWDDVIRLQVKFVRRYGHYLGISDLLIVQNAVQNDLPIYSFDNDVKKLCDLVGHECLN
jgi:predicted nucleic acid-binding protein